MGGEPWYRVALTALACPYRQPFCGILRGDFRETFPGDKRGEAGKNASKRRHRILLGLLKQVKGFAQVQVDTQKVAAPITPERSVTRLSPIGHP